jgi:glycosyltransferase involved in cell wall biosynthesis
MKLILIDGFYLGKGRGVGNYIKNLVSRISEVESTEINIVIACTDDALNMISEEGVVKLWRFPRLPFPIWENLLIPMLSAWLRPDVIHFPANTSPFLPISGRRMVTIHDTIFLHSHDVVPQSNVLRQRIGRLYLALNTRLLARYYKRILTVSECSKRDIQSALGVSSDRVKVIYEGPGITFTVGNVPLKSRKILLHFASRDPRKNTQRVIEAFQMSQASRSGFTLHLVGSGFSLSRIPSEIQSSVHIHEFLPVSKLQKLVDNTFLLLYPSLYEGFGMPIVEFQRLGIPVVTSNSSACAEVGANGSILVNPKNIADITRGIDALCNNDALAGVIAEAAFANSHNFQWDECAKAVLKEYVTI